MHISLNKTAKLFIASMLMILAFAGTYIFFFISMRDKVTQAAELSLKAEDLSGKDARIDATLDILETEALTMEKISKNFIKESEIVDFAKTVETLGPLSKTKLTIESLEPGVGDRSIPVLNFRVKAQGEFKNIIALIALLENFPARLDWNSVRIAHIETPVVTVEADPKTKTPAKALPPGPPLWSTEISLTALNFVRE